MANFRIEIRYAVLTGLLTLLWLSLEYMVGLQDTYIQYYRYIHFLSFLIIPVICIGLALRDKLEVLDGKLTFKHAFFTGFLISFFGAVLIIPCLIVFYKLINPDFFDTMIDYAVNKQALVPADEADMVFSLTALIIQSGLLTLITGTIVALFLAWRTNTEN